MKTQIIRSGSKVVVKFHIQDETPDPSSKTIRKLEKKLACKLSYCQSRDGLLILWNGPSNVRVAGWVKFPNRMRSETGFNFKDMAGHGRTPEICKVMQRSYGKIRYAKTWSTRAYEGIVRPKANGITVASFHAPKLP